MNNIIWFRVKIIWIGCLIIDWYGKESMIVEILVKGNNFGFFRIIYIGCIMMC